MFERINDLAPDASEQSGSRPVAVAKRRVHLKVNRGIERNCLRRERHVGLPCKLLCGVS
jgi:hypothetical protein